MTYEEAVAEVRKIPLSESAKIRDYILALKDIALINQLCSKWYSILCRDIHYQPEPAQPAAYSQMMQALREKNEVWRVYMNDPVMKVFVETKRKVNCENAANYDRVKIAIDNLYDREIAARKELINKILEFINGTVREQERPFPGYEYYNRQDLDKYGIRPEGSMRDVLVGV